jgi:hypothetical protein
MADSTEAALKTLRHAAPHLAEAEKCDGGHDEVLLSCVRYTRADWNEKLCTPQKHRPNRLL